MNIKHTKSFTEEPVAIHGGLKGYITFVRLRNLLVEAGEVRSHEDVTGFIVDEHGIQICLDYKTK